MYLFISTITTTELELHEWIGQILSLGILLAVCGINVAHELGHRSSLIEQLSAQALLLPSFYLHFTIEHNSGHHKQVATPSDPATARLNESLYAFWIRSVISGYQNAWKLETLRLERIRSPFFSLKNKMIRFLIIQFFYILTILAAFGSMVLLLLFACGVVSFLLLETINYIEHYGIVRKKLVSGTYERVQAKHSWNSDHILGRIILYELTRHSDHHCSTSKKYQTLESLKDAPQLPYGYPGSMLLSLLPVLWYKKINPIVQQYQG